jgi:hypothetical protein
LFFQFSSQAGMTLPLFLNQQYARRSLQWLQARVSPQSSVMSGCYGFAVPVILLLMQLSIPAGAAYVTLSDSSSPELATEIVTAGSMGQIKPQIVEPKLTADPVLPADSVGAVATGVVPARSVAEPQTGPSSRPDDSPPNRLMLFFLLLMAVVFGLLMEITSARQRR